LDEVRFDSGMRLLRVTIREGKRITRSISMRKPHWLGANYEELGERETERER